MATPSKDKLYEMLRDLNVDAPAGMSSQDLQTLYRKVKALPVVAPGADRPAPMDTVRRPPAVAPPMRPPAPLASPVVSSNIGAVARSSGSSPSFFGHRPTPIPAVAVAPAPSSDRDARPWDPFAGA